MNSWVYTKIQSAKSNLNYTEKLTFKNASAFLLRGARHAIA